MTDKQTELQTKLVDDQKPSKFSITKQDLLRIVDMDNRPVHGEEGASKAAKIIMEEFNGPEGVANRLKTNTETGIRFNEDERKDRVDEFGPNFFQPPKIKTLCELIMENFEDQINKILLIAALVSLVIGIVKDGFAEGWLEGVSIMLALCIIIIVSSGNNYASEKRLANLIALAEKQDVPVYRKGNGETETVSYEDLVVGDLIALSKGMKVPADCMVVENDNLFSKEDALTGEPDALPKNALTQQNYNEGKDCVIFAKATISDGTGKGIVLVVGEDTVAGGIQKKVQEQGEEGDNQTLLQKKLNSIANQIGNVGYGCAGLTFIAILIRLILELSGVINCGCKNLVTCEAPSVETLEDGTKKFVGCDVLDLSSINNRFYTELLNTVIIAITVIVVAIPEGLPLAVTISLSFSSAKLQKAHNLVRKLASAETMGAVTHICSDKTGTLTENVMTTMSVMGYQKRFAIKSADQLKDLSSQVNDGIGQDGWKLLSECAMWNSGARIEEKEDKGFTGTANAELVYNGNVTDQGILKFFAETMGKSEVKKKMTNRDEVLTEIPFDSKNKRATTVFKRSDGTVRVYTKGAPDVLYAKNPEIVEQKTKQEQEANPKLSLTEARARAEKNSGYGLVRYVAVPGGKADWYDNATNEQTTPDSLDELMRLQGRSGQTPQVEDIFQSTVKDFACQAYRTILCCYKDMSMRDYEAVKAANNNFETTTDRQAIEKDLIAIGLFGIQDPLRPQVKGSVEQVREAGIQVIMCTGDNIDTATAISKNAGIVEQKHIDANPQYTTMIGQDFRQIVGQIKKVKDPEDPSKMKEVVGNQFNFNQVIKHLRVLARSSPEDKYLLVTGLQNTPYEDPTDTESGKSENTTVNYCSVAVTGDGTNDAPALAKSDVGFSMGITGTDIAKGASDIILLEDDFSHIITALRYGRNIYDNVRKFLQFQLTVNVVAMFIVFFGSLMLSDSPLTAVQMLWVNLIMDTLAALALATEPPDDDILQRMPQPSSKSIVTPLMWRNVNGHAVYQIIVLIVIIFAAQGSLVQNYDVKCLKTRVENGPCPKGGLNPWYAADHYFERETMDYWTKLPAEESEKEAFEENQWVLFQCANLYEHFPTETAGKDCNDMATSDALLKEVITGDAYTKVKDLVGGLEDDYFFLPQKIPKGTGTQKLLHMTYVFQIFVFMQVFNQMNARLLTGSFNIFEGMCRNWLFVAVALSTFVVQMLMVEVGGKVTKTYPLEMWRNGICLLFGSGELIWGVFIKFLPVKFFQCINFDEKPMTEEEHEKSVLGKFKGSSVRKPKNAMEEQIGDNLVAQVRTKMAEQQAN